MIADSSCLSVKTSASIRKERLREDRVDELSGTLSQVHIQGSNSRKPNAQTSSQSAKEAAHLYTAVSFNALDLTGLWTKLDDVPTSVGGNSDIYKAELAMDIHRNDGKQLVAIKVLRSVRIPANRETSEILKKRLMREMAVWSQLHHVNVVPFLGYGFTGDFPCLVAPWYVNGQIPDYMTRNPNIDRTPLVMGVIDGLVYLHSFDPPIVHGDLKASNVLVDDQGYARITDFGLSRMLQEGPSGFTTSSGITSTHRWMAPELFMTEGAKYTTASDIYAMSLLILEGVGECSNEGGPSNLAKGRVRRTSSFNIALALTSRESSNNLQVRDPSRSSESLRCMTPKQYDTGGYDISIKAYEEDVKIGRELVERDRRTHLPALSLSLHRLGWNFEQARRHIEALEVLMEAVKMRRELVQRDRRTHLPNLSASLHRLGFNLEELQRHNEALEVYNEAVKMRRELVERDRSTHLPELSASLDRLGSSL
ncbi:hypothetical protein FRC02_012213 [Tulasnella sp. 418]|nr:hypothetical protein FRC02_012213 [Tulasnella sp. 418]